MQIIIKHIWRNIKSNSLRSLLIIISLTLASSVFYVNLNIRDDAIDSTRIILQGPYKDYDICVTGEVEDAELPECEKTIEIETCNGIIDEKIASISYLDLERVVGEGLITLDDSEDNPIPESMNSPGNAILTRTKALYLNLKPGDDFKVSIDGKEKEYTLLCYAKSLGFFANGSSEVMEILTFDEDIEANMTLAALINEEDMDSVCDEISEEEDIEAFALYDSNGTSHRLESIRKIMSTILILVIAIAFYVISSTSNLIINYRIPVLGTFRSLGATAFSTSFILVCENILYGITASIPAMLIGEFLRTKMRTFGLGVEAGQINILYIILVPVFSVGINVAISLFSIMKETKKPIHELIFKKQSAASKPSVGLGILGLAMLATSFVIAYYNTKYDFVLLAFELALSVIGSGLSIGMICMLVSRFLANTTRTVFGGPSWMGIKNLSVSKTNRSTSLLVTMVIALVLMVYICAGSVTNFFSVYENNYPYDIMIKRAIGGEEEQKYLEELDGVTSVVYEYWDIGRPLVNGEEKRTCFCANDGFSNGIEAEDGLLENLQNGEVIIDKMYAVMNDFNVGDVITFNTSYEDNEMDDFSLKVVGLCDSGVFYSDRTTVVITREDFYKYIKVEPAIIGVSTNMDVGEMIADINDAVAKETGNVYAVYSKKDYVGDEVNEALTAAKSVSIVPILALILALFGLVNNQIIAFNQKRMEYAVLYSTAMSRRQLAGMMISEIIFSFATGCICGLALSFWLAKIMRDIIFVTVAYVPLVITYKNVLMTLLIFCVLLIITLVFPLGRLKKLNIISEIKYE